jgi:hypothetical protein
MRIDKGFSIDEFRLAAHGPTEVPPLQVTMDLCSRRTWRTLTTLQISRCKSCILYRPGAVRYITVHSLAIRAHDVAGFPYPDDEYLHCSSDTAEASKWLCQGYRNRLIRSPAQCWVFAKSNYDTPFWFNSSLLPESSTSSLSVYEFKKSYVDWPTKQ